MRVGKRHTRPIGCQLVIAVLTLLIAGCSKPEEVISRRLAQANKNLESGQVPEAVQILERLNQSYIDQPAVLEALGFAYARADQHAAAAASFERAADIDSQSGSLRQLAANSYFRADVFDRAAQQYRLYLNEFPGDYTSWEKLGQIEEANGDLLRANDAFLECYRLRPNGEIAWRLGNVFRRLNNAPQAKAWFETTIKHAGAKIDAALLGLLELEVNARDFAAAERTLNQLDTIYPGTLEASPLADVRDNIARWRSQQQALNAARATQQDTAREIEAERRRREAELAAIQAQPATSVALPANLPPDAATPTIPPSSTGMADGAATAPAVASPPPSSPAGSGALPTAAGEPATTGEPAPAASTSGLSPGPELPPDLRAAEDLRQRGRTGDAIAALWTIIANDDSRVDAWLALGRCFRSQRQLGDAESCLLEAQRRAPDNLEVAIEYLEVVRDSAPSDIYFARVDAARQKFPASAHLAYFLAHALAAMDGATARAVSAYDDFLLLADPGDPRRREASAYLARVRGY